MKIQVISDLHLEFPQNFKYVMENWEFLGDILVMAGDVCAWSRVDKYQTFLTHISKKYDMVIHVPGNHEYYGMDIGLLEEQLFCQRKFTNCHLMNNSKIRVNNVTFICSTLWSHAHPKVENMIGDYHYINGMTIETGNKYHKDSVETITNLLSQTKGGYKVVITHHLPLFECVSDRYVGNQMNTAFVSDQSKIIGKHKIDYWIHGHSHEFLEKKINNTTFIRNPVGYVHTGETSRFIRPFVIELN